MLKRRLAPEPVAAAADRCRLSAGFAALLSTIAVFLGRSGSVDPHAAIAVLASGLLFAGLAILLGMWSLVVIWRTGRRGTGRAFEGMALALAVLAYPAYLAVLAATLPDVGDVSTDPAVPPPFSTAPAARAARGGVVHEEPGPEAVEAQRRAYPGLAPVVLDLAGDEAFELVLKTVRARNWRIVEAVPPKGKFGTGHIDAVATGRVMGLPDDVAIRIRPLSGQTRVDIRSASRFGRGDVGAGAARIQSLSDDLQDADS